MFLLKHEDNVVFEFDPVTKFFRLVSNSYLPVSLCSLSPSYSMVAEFCTSRILLYNRAYFKEIVLACGLENQDPVSICIASMGFSFTDNYWIDTSTSKKLWKDCNIRSNIFRNDLSLTALTGIPSAKRIILNDNFYTGELTVKGTRPKCFIRRDKEVFLLKNETTREIASEIVSYVIARALNLNSSIYSFIKYQGVNCSCCEIDTRIDNELVHCRDIMSYYNAVKPSDSCVYNFFYRLDARNFILMQLFDYLTLNTDRNRDNYGMRCYRGNPLDLYPLYDHDSCFKGKSVKALYFVTGTTFEETLKIISRDKVFYIERDNIYNACTFYKTFKFKEFFTNYLTLEDYNKFMDRVDTVLLHTKQ